MTFRSGRYVLCGLFVLGLFLVAGGRASGDIKLIPSADKVHLIDGTVVEGTVIARGTKAVIVIVGDKEERVPAEKVQRIEYGAQAAAVSGYMTDPVDGVKCVTGEGFRDTEEEEEEEVEETGKEAKPKKPKKGAGKRRAASGRAGEITPETIRQLAKSNPDVAQAVKMVGGPEVAARLIRENADNPMFKQYINMFTGSSRRKKRGK